MLNDIHNAVRQLVYERGGIDPLDVDIRFDVPSEEWVNSLLRPTISLYLFDLQENTDKRETNLQTVRGTGRTERRLPPRRIDLFHMVSVLTAEAEDEHELLGRVLATLMKYQQLPAEVLPDTLRSLELAISTRLGNQQDGRQLLEVWNALGTKPHPALCYIVTAPLDLEVAVESPLVLSRTVRYRNAVIDNSIDSIRTHIGGVIRNRTGQPLANITVAIESTAEESITNNDGQYVLRRIQTGPVTLNVSSEGKVRKRLTVSVPARSYDIVMDE
jgi:hypothetical protein